MKDKKVFRILAAAGYLGMIIVNALAVFLPINGIATGQVSDSYPNLFAPAGYTFSIWGIIYLFLAGYSLYQLGLLEKVGKEALLEKVNKYFLLSSLANIAWIFSWHYLLMPLTVLLMLVILISLIKIADLLKKEKFSGKEKLLIKTPFSLYFGWITVATIANITVFLVSLNWNGLGLSEIFWTTIILIVGCGIGIWRTLKDRNLIYNLVLIWAYWGIYNKHISVSGFGGSYPSIINTIIVCLALFLGTDIYLVFKNRTDGRNSR
ncbi:MAG: hypothetical protein BWY24_00342 [Microgenomates group bacterium ADurb.Bin219]|nr:MAG: hypothetical protein BWY24_00342 [Microgenomates group bacterium ADurb.Bin219]